MDELEAKLRQFQPRRPRPLPGVARSHRKRPLVWIAMSGVAAAVLLMLARYERAPVVEAPRAAGVTLGALNAYMLMGPEKLDDALTSTSAVTLPDVEWPGGALHALSKE
jgi:hypothetical protein